jgi:hypothetical protein
VDWEKFELCPQLPSNQGIDCRQHRLLKKAVSRHNLRSNIHKHHADEYLCLFALFQNESITRDLYLVWPFVLLDYATAITVPLI